MVTQTILTLDAYIIALIFSFVMFDSFYDFANIFWVWYRSQTLRTIKYVLEKLDWEKIYDFDQEADEFLRQRFQNFIGTCVEVDIVPAKFYYCCKRLFVMDNIHANLNILCDQSAADLPSQFAYLVFKAIFQPYDTNSTARDMSTLVKSPNLRMKIPYLIKLLQKFYEADEDKLLPRKKLCMHARDPTPFNSMNWPPSYKEIWYSLCNKTVDANFLDESGVLCKPLTMDHILHTPCPYCSLQIILFKILQGGYLYY